MLVYLGMPKCASTWLYSKIRNQFNYAGPKEPHTLYEKGTLHNKLIDFSTNNWSMDSSTARTIDPLVSHYILIARDPVEVAISYYVQVGSTQPFNDFCMSLYNNKLLCFGDIVERWYNLVDKDKILLYNYDTDIVNNQSNFIAGICEKINIPYIEIDNLPVHQTINKPALTCSLELENKLRYQMDKFNDYAINKLKN